MALAHAAIQLGILGPSGTCTGGPEAGVQALREAIAAVAEGRCEAALAGACDQWVDAGALRDRARLGLLAPPGEAGVALRLERPGAPGVAARTRFYVERGPAGLDPVPPPPHRAALGYCGAADGLLALVLGPAGLTAGEAPGACCEVRVIPC